MQLFHRNMVYLVKLCVPYVKSSALLIQEGKESNRACQVEVEYWLVVSEFDIKSINSFLV